MRWPATPPLEIRNSRFARHPRAVVRDRNQGRAPIPDFDPNRGRSGIETVLDQFLHHRGGTLDDLAGGDLVDQRVREEANSAFFVFFTQMNTRGAVLRLICILKVTQVQLPRKLSCSINQRRSKMHLSCRQIVGDE